MYILRYAIDLQCHVHESLMHECTCSGEGSALLCIHLDFVQSCECIK